MHGDGFFYQAFVYLLAAVVSVPIAKKLGLGSVLGYLTAGVVIGPFALGLVGAEGQDVMHFAEFGVVMMLFLVGLELQPSLLWKLKAPILGMGGLQVGATAGVIAVVGLALGFAWQVTVAVGLILALSSTAIVLQSLAEKGLMKTPGGERCFSVLLFQDISVIPVLAILPMLAVSTIAGADGSHDGIGALPGWQQALIVAALIGLIVVGGKLLVRPAFRLIAATRLREVFTAAALLLVIGIALAMQKVGLSPALGTFLAGVVLAESEYRHELESDIEPFKGLLLGLFFIAVGASIDFTFLRENPQLVTQLVVGLVAVKLLVLAVVGRLFRLEWSQNFLFTFALAQGGEFAFVLFSFATQNGVLSPEIANPLVATVALSMAATPLLMILNEKFIQPRFAVPKQQEADLIEEQHPVIIAGYGRFGHIVGRMLKANGINATVLDLDPEQIETLARFGMKVFYGDAARLDLLHTAGLDRAKLLILAIDDPEKCNGLVEAVRQRHPEIVILARAHSLHHAYELTQTGADQVFRETLDSAITMGEQALKAVGFRSYQAHRAGRIFRKHERTAMGSLFNLWAEGESFWDHAREHVSELERMMQQDQLDFAEAMDHAWEAASPEAEEGSDGSTSPSS